MTTIAYRDGIVAADSRCTVNGWVQGHKAVKLRRMRDGSVTAVCGNYALAKPLADWLDQEGEKPNRPTLEDASVIHFQPGGVITVYELAGSFDVDCEYTAFGSGSPPALAALYMGADARRAVEIAAMIDSDTGGEILSMEAPV